MPTYDTTPKHGLRILQGSNAISDIDAGFQALAEDIEAIMAIADQGPFASRPVSTPGSPGKAGRFYYATNTNQIFFDHGTGWIEIANAKVPAVKVRRTTDQTITGATGAISWEAEDYDTHGQWAIGNPTKLVCVEPGLYIAQGAVRTIRVGSVPTAYEQLLVQRFPSGGGTAVSLGEAPITPSRDIDGDQVGDFNGNISIPVELAAGDALSLLIDKNASILVDATVGMPWFAMTHQGRLS